MAKHRPSSVVTSPPPPEPTPEPTQEVKDAVLVEYPNEGVVTTKLPFSPLYLHHKRLYLHYMKTTGSHVILNATSYGTLGGLGMDYAAVNAVVDELTLRGYLELESGRGGINIRFTEKAKEILDAIDTFE